MFFGVVLLFEQFQASVTGNSMGDVNDQVVLIQFQKTINRTTMVAWSFGTSDGRFSEKFLVADNNDFTVNQSKTFVDVSQT